MSYFDPPTNPEFRQRTPPCGVRHGTDRCSLYRGHAAEQHKDLKTGKTWREEDAVQAPLSA